MIQDLRYGLRMLGKSPGLTAILALTLALGIGVNTAIFSVLNGWLLRPLPARAPEQIMALGSQQKERGGDTKFSYADLVDFRKQSGATFSDLFAYRMTVGGLTINNRSSLFAFCDVTGNYFTALGVKPLLGRLFLPGEGEQPRGETIVVLGYSYWQRNFGGDPAIVGKQVLVDGRPATVLGVTPPEFHGTFFAFDLDGYLPLSATALDQESSGDMTGFWTDRRNRSLSVLGRLKPSVTVPQAQASLDVVAERLGAQYPETNKGVTVRVIPERMARPAPFVTSFVPVIAGLFLALAVLVLVLASMNVANIFLARANARQREMAIRASLGAGRGRLVRQMLTESLLLALLGTIGGVLLGHWAISGSGSVLNSATSDSAGHAFRIDTSFDWKVFSYTLAVRALHRNLCRTLACFSRRTRRFESSAQRRRAKRFGRRRASGIPRLTCGGPSRGLADVAHCGRPFRSKPPARPACQPGLRSRPCLKPDDRSPSGGLRRGPYQGLL